ncbi:MULTISPECIES: nuclear transport factor 2 family protein [Streptomyces]|uniref:SnoaL-like domain-containing protein n=1 Tax=Streptomyces phaeolivaceus TaxID=2653200 RepID=A0A5P8KGC0_9ACTN|nr:nuclear transport factor 2 family protein [Streptomyces phaeolivaceus]QFR01678.1 hypothetical protein F9278_42010 [Streptomyces phaeolivaceus]
MSQTTVTKTAGSTNPTGTVVDRYIRIFDRTAHDPQAVEELESIFAQDAVVQLAEGIEPVAGLPAIMAVYRGFVSQMADSQHFWTVTELDDGRLECEWVQAGRSVDGRLVCTGGVEQVTVNADGQITKLINRIVPNAGW